MNPTQLTLEETTLIQNGICPDCDTNQSKILSGPQGPGSKNVLCDNCKEHFNVPLMRGLRRVGILKKVEAPVPLKMPDGEGTIVQGKGQRYLHRFTQLS